MSEWMQYMIGSCAFSAVAMQNTDSPLLLIIGLGYSLYCFIKAIIAAIKGR